MNLLMHLSRSAHQLQRALHHMPWSEDQEPPDPPSGSFVLAVALVSMAAAAVLVLAP